MEPKANYTIVGLFVVVLLAAIIITAIWLSAGVSHKQYKLYRVYMNESVAGLSPNSPVQYNGVTVGRIRSIHLNAKNPQQVKLLLAIEAKTPITKSTTATLMSQGLTGIAYIGLRSDSSDLTPLRRQPGEEYPVIKTSPSLMMRLDTVLSGLSTNLTQISDELHSLLDAENRAAFKQTLQNVNQLTATLTTSSKQLNTTLKSVNTIMENSARASQQLPGLMNNLSVTSNNLLNTSKAIQQNPSILLRGETSPPPGPGEH